MRLLPIPAIAVLAPAAAVAVILAAQVRAPEPAVSMESVLPALAYGPACATEIELRNLGDRVAAVEVEGHRGSGALVALAGLPGTTLRLAPHQRSTYKLEISEETGSAWAKVRERGPPGSAPAVAVSASIECIDDDRMRTVRRDVAFPQISPWFDSDASGFAGGVVSLINASASSALARVCYSAGNLYSVPGRGQRPGELTPICSVAFDVQIPPFGEREFPVEREGSHHFSLRTFGRAIILEMLRPLDAHIRIYRVDSTIRFDGEPPDPVKR